MVAAVGCRRGWWQRRAKRDDGLWRRWFKCVASRAPSIGSLLSRSNPLYTYIYYSHSPYSLSRTASVIHSSLLDVLVYTSLSLSVSLARRNQTRVFLILGRPPTDYREYIEEARRHFSPTRIQTGSKVSFLFYSPGLVKKQNSDVKLYIRNLF